MPRTVIDRERKSGGWDCDLEQCNDASLCRDLGLKLVLSDGYRLPYYERDRICMADMAIGSELGTYSDRLQLRIEGTSQNYLNASMALPDCFVVLRPDHPERTTKPRRHDDDTQPIHL